jgi:hypothetical protein
MPNPVYGDIHVDTPLTNMSVAYIQDQSAFVADKIFPIVPVKKQSDLYYIYSKADFLRNEADIRVYGAESKGGGYNLSKSPYFCNIFAFHKDVYPTDRTNSDDPLQPDADATEFVTNKLVLKREIDFQLRFFATGIWGTEYYGAGASSGLARLYWSSASSTPLEDIGNAQIGVQAVTGKKPNTLLLGPYTYLALRDNSEVRNLLRYTQGPKVPTPDMLAQMFDVERVLVGNAVYNAAAENATEDTDFILGKHALLCYTENAPGIKKVSAGYIFSWTGLEGAGAFGNRIYKLPMDLLGLGTTRIEGEMTYDIEVISTTLGVFFRDIVQ